MLAEVTAAKNQVAEDQAKLQQDGAAQAAAQAITATISGQVLAVDTSSGSAVQSGQDLLEIGSAGRWVIDASINQIDLPIIYKGQGGEATVSGIDADVPVAVTEIDPTSSGSNRYGAVYPIVLTVEGSATLTQGVEVTVSLPGIYLTTTGAVEYSETQEVTAPIAGTTEGLTAAVGDTVQAGSTRMSITSSAEDLQVLQDQDALTSAQQNLGALTEGDSQTSNAVLSAKAEVTSDQQTIAQDETASAELAVGGGTLIERAFGWSALIDWNGVTLALGFSVAVGILFGLWPALRASSLDPAEALLQA